MNQNFNNGMRMQNIVLNIPQMQSVLQSLDGENYKTFMSALFNYVAYGQLPNFQNPQLMEIWGAVQFALDKSINKYLSKQMQQPQQFGYPQQQFVPQYGQAQRQYQYQPQYPPQQQYVPQQPAYQPSGEGNGWLDSNGNPTY